MSQDTVELTLEDRAERIRRYLALSAEFAVLAGLELRAVRDALPWGAWEQWCWSNVGISPVKARRFIRVAEFLERYTEGQEQMAEFAENADRTGLYLLASNSTPEEAREEAVAHLRQGHYLSRAIVTAIVERMERDTEKAELLENASAEIVALDAEHDLDPEVLEMLMRMQVQQPEAFEEVALSGAISNASGDAIALGDANKRDLRDYVEHDRFETSMRKMQEERPRAIRLDWEEFKAAMNAMSAALELLDNPASEIRSLVTSEDTGPPYDGGANTYDLDAVEAVATELRVVIGALSHRLDDEEE